MESNTKQAIIDYVISKAEKKPLKQITIGEIGKAVGITRNTFYYYFKDIYDVLDQAISVEFAKLIDAPVDNDEQALFDIIEFTVMYKKVWVNLYRTIGQERLRTYVLNKVDGVFNKYIEAHLDGMEISDLDMGILKTYFEEALFGVLVRWIRGESRGSTPQEMQSRVLIIIQSLILKVWQEAWELKQVLRTLNKTGT